MTQIKNATFQPFRDRILVAELAEDTITEGGIVLPDSVGSRNQIRRGRVDAVGPGLHDHEGKMRPTSTKVGDIVVFNAYIGAEIQLDGQKYKIMGDAEIMGKVIFENA